MLTGETEPSVSNSMMASLITLKTKLPYSANPTLSERWYKPLNIMTISTENGWRNTSFFAEETLDPPPLYHAPWTPDPPLHHSIHLDNHPTLPNNTTHNHPPPPPQLFDLLAHPSPNSPTVRPD